MINLDALYDDYWNSPRSKPSPDALITGVRKEAIRLTQSEDIAQDVCIIVLDKLESFSRSDPTAFSRWVRTIIRRTRLDAFRTASMHTREFDEQTVTYPDFSYPDISGLPDDVLHIAHQLIKGYSLVEVADQLKM